MNKLAMRHENGLQNQQSLTSEMFSRFTAYIDGSPKTVATYTKAIKQFINWMHVNGIDRPDRSDIMRYRDELKATCKPNTVQLYIVAVRQFFKWAEQEGIYRNVADHVKGSKIDRAHKKDALTSAQVKEILARITRDTLQGMRDYSIVSLAVTSGTRTVELQRANIEDIRTAADSTVIYVQGKGKEEKSEYKKLIPQVEKAIRAYLKARGAVSPKEPLFASHSDRNDGGRMWTESISRIIKNAFRQAGYDSDRLTAHSCRHTAATLNLMNGGTLTETKQLLGHSDINTTEIYNHSIDRARNNSEARIGAVIFEQEATA